MFSPPLANLAEALLFLSVLLHPELRQALIDAWRQPLFKATVAFWLLIGAGLLYTVATPQAAISMWGGWRKLLLVPVALALFDTASLKRRLIISVVTVCTVVAFVSFVAWAFNAALPEHESGVLLRNHSSQGMIFAISAFSAAVLAAHDPRRRWLLAASILLLANIAFVTPGRSGYVVMLACATAYVFARVLAAGINLKNIAISLVTLLMMGTLLLAAPTSRDRIGQAFSEMRNYEQEQQITSMGIRMVFWKNTLKLIAERPIAGFGTGAFGTAYGQFVSGRTGIEATPTGDPHNQFMKIAAEHGLIGLFVFLWMLAAALTQRASKPWRLLGLGALLAWCATSLANSHFSTFTEGTFIFVWLGAMLASERTESTAANSATPISD